LDGEYFRQLTAERVVTRYERGRPIRFWQPKRAGERNEALDTFVYASAALLGLLSMGLNNEAEVLCASPRKGADLKPARPSGPLKVIRSQWRA